jgi:hypothetical protein
LFLIGQFLKVFFSETTLPNELKLGRKHLWKVQKIFRNQPTRNNNCLWQPCLLTDRGEISNLYRGPSIVAFYQVSVHLVKWFQRRRLLEIDQSETRIACGSTWWEVPMEGSILSFLKAE